MRTTDGDEDDRDAARTRRDGGRSTMKRMDRVERARPRFRASRVYRFGRECVLF